MTWRGLPPPSPPYQPLGGSYRYFGVWGELVSDLYAQPCFPQLANAHVLCSENTSACERKYGCVNKSQARHRKIYALRYMKTGVSDIHLSWGLHSENRRSAVYGLQSEGLHFVGLEPLWGLHPGESTLWGN